MNIEELMKHYREPLAQWITTFLTEYEEHIKDASPKQQHLFDKLRTYTTSGKAVRGCLVLGAHKALGGEREEDAYALAAACELIHSGLLMHDDILDRDDTRRGKPSMHKQYERLAHQQNLHYPEHYGQGMSIMAGDVAFFLAIAAIGRANLGNGLNAKITNEVACTISKVGLANMNDFELGLDDRLAQEDDILKVYQYKTAHYTFCLPLILGAMLAGAGEETIEALRETGEPLGILFQLRDDEIGIMQPTEVQGKPAGSDISEGKQTWLLWNLRRELDESRLECMRGLEQLELTEDHITWVKEQLEETGVLTKYKEKCDALIAQTKESIKSTPESLHELLESTLRFTIERKK